MNARPNASLVPLLRQLQYDHLKTFHHLLVKDYGKACDTVRAAISAVSDYQLDSHFEISTMFIFKPSKANNI